MGDRGVLIYKQSVMKKHNKVKPTLLQRKTLEILKENPDMPLGKAMISAGYAEKTSRHPKRKLVESKGLSVAIKEWAEVLRGRGLGEERLLEKYEEHLEAKRVVSARIVSKDADSTTDDFIEVPDYQAQARAVEWMREDLGLKNTGNGGVTINFNKMVTNQKQEYGI